MVHRERLDLDRRSLCQLRLPGNCQGKVAAVITAEHGTLERNGNLIAEFNRTVVTCHTDSYAGIYIRERILYGKGVLKPVAGYGIGHDKALDPGVIACDGIVPVTLQFPQGTYGYVALGRNSGLDYRQFPDEPAVL